MSDRVALVRERGVWGEPPLARLPRFIDRAGSWEAVALVAIAFNVTPG